MIAFPADSSKVSIVFNFVSECIAHLFQNNFLWKTFIVWIRLFTCGLSDNIVSSSHWVELKGSLINER
jgi:hypothetical protein